jgi:hypothetical protein
MNHLVLIVFTLSLNAKLIKSQESLDMPKSDANLLENNEKDSLLGYGYDLLTNSLTEPIFLMNDSCRLSQEFEDNDEKTKRHFLIVESMNQYQLLTSKSMHKKFDLAGAYSNEYRNIKEILNFHDYVFVRLEISHNHLKQHLKNCGLNPRFSNQIQHILRSIKQEKHDKARYLTQILLHDYGTHAITSSLKGANLIMQTFLDKNFYESIKTQENKNLEDIVLSYFNNKYLLGLNSISEIGDLIKFIENSHLSSMYSIGGVFEKNTSNSILPIRFFFMSYNLRFWTFLKLRRFVFKLHLF